MASAPSRDRDAFNSAVAAMRADVAMAGSTAAWEAGVRSQYDARIRAFVIELQREVAAGRITWADAARQAQAMRNNLLSLMRGRSSPVGRALAEWLKPAGRSLNDLIAQYTIRRHGAGALFDRLTTAQRDAVFADVVAAAARSNADVNRWVTRAGRAGRGLLILSIGLSIHAIATSPDPAATARREVAVTGAGIAGGVAGGALAGLMCGPGAPVCVTIGAFAGGAAAAFGVDFFW